MIIGTAGHIDHGKTTLVHALTGIDTDRLPEERRRGITIELGFAPLELPGIGQVGIVDVPGHEGFVRTMVAGATGVDLGLLVIAADEGVMPQTREHLAILRLLEVRSLVVAVTKSDLADPDWLDLVRDEVRTLLAETSYAGAAMVDVSARTGAGLGALKESLSSALRGVVTRDGTDLFRLPIDRVFTVRGTGTVVTGTSWSGTLDGTTDLRLLPAGKPVRLRGIQVHGTEVAQAGPGSRLAVAISGVDLAAVGRGMTLASSAAWAPTQHFHADVSLLHGAESFRPREWLRLHVGTTEVSARVVIAAGAGGIARVVTEEPVVLRAGDRFVLRRSQPLGTIGGGRVVDPAPGRLRRRPPSLWDRDPLRRMGTLLTEAGTGGLSVSEIPIRVGCTPSEVPAMLAAGVVFRDRVYDEGVVDACAQDVENAVVGFLASHGTEVGASTSAWSTVRSNPALVDLAVERLVAAGHLAFRGATLCPPGWEPRFSAEQGEAARWVMERLQSAGREPPSIAELAAERPGTPLLPVLRFLERTGRLILVEADRYFTKESVTEMIEGLVGQMKSSGRPETPATLREVLGVSRKYLMPFLEYCDRERITERRGDGRVLSGRGPVA
jgi:selenocysteine-specific elongation factor